MPPTLALRPVLAVVVVKSAFSLAFAGRYGWQRDELYYRVAGDHLQAGYVEFPPVTALLAALSRVLFGDSLVGLRGFAIAAGAGVVLVAALIARELGAGRRGPTHGRRSRCRLAGPVQRALPAGVVRPAGDDRRALACAAARAGPREPIARCTLAGSLSALWPRVVALYD